MIHVMLDLETAGRPPDGAIVQIGAAAFEPLGTGVLDTFSRRVSLRSAVAGGGTLNAASIQWWLGEDDEVRRHVFGVGAEPRDAPIPLDDALHAFSFWYKSVAGVRIWANGTTFDMPILESAYQRRGFRVPWSYRDVRDMRWFRDVVPHSVTNAIYSSREGLAHDAESDAVVQARVVQAAYRSLGIPQEQYEDG